VKNSRPLGEQSERLREFSNASDNLLVGDEDWLLGNLRESKKISSG
jgi:hypothetical protein